MLNLFKMSERERNAIEIRLAQAGIEKAEREARMAEEANEQKALKEREEVARLSMQREQEERKRLEFVMPAKPAMTAIEPMMNAAHIEEYHQVASAIGVNVPELMVEKLKLFLIKMDYPSYNLKEVVAYMDALAKRDNPDGWGWEWKPLRALDTRLNILFGTMATDNTRFTNYLLMGLPEKISASDYFSSQSQLWTGTWGPTPSYAKIVPLHALKRVAAIEQEFGMGKIAFAVSDYATQPHVRPDPFLMAMVPNPRIHEGIGRFVIDVWDEPGFGIEQMLK